MNNKKHVHSGISNETWEAGLSVYDKLEIHIRENLPMYTEGLAIASGITKKEILKKK